MIEHAQRSEVAATASPKRASIAKDRADSSTTFHAQADASLDRHTAQPAPSRDLDEGLAGGQVAAQGLQLVETLLPAYEKAVGAFDAKAATELAQNILGGFQLATDGQTQVAATLGSDPVEHWMVSTPGKATPSPDDVRAKWNALDALGRTLAREIEAARQTLATRIGPQQLDGVPVLGR